MNQVRQENRTYLFRLFYAAFLGGLSLASAVALLASSAWLISMASTMPPILLLQVVIVGVRFFGISRGVFRYAERLLSHDTILRIQSKLQVLIYQRLEARPLQYLSLSQGKVLNRIINDVEFVQDKWVRVWIPWCGSLIAGVCGAGIIYWLSPIAGLITLAILIFTLFIVPRVTTIGSQSSAAKIAESESYLGERISSSITGHMEARIFNYSDKYSEDLKKVESDLAFHEKATLKISGLATFLVYIAMGINIIINAVIAINSFESGSLAGVNIAVLTLLPLAIYDSIATLPSAFSNKSKMDRSEEFLNEVLDESLAEEKVNSQSSSQPFNSRIVFENATALWRDNTANKAPATLTIEPGESVLISGMSGSGKSSLALALLGLIPYQGSISLGGVEVRELDSKVLAGAITACLQSDYIFATSIRENLKIANPEANDDDIKKVLTDLGLDYLANDLDQHLGAFGTTISGGEQQRIRVARALLRDTPIYIFDEPTEYLNEELAQLVRSVIKERLANKTLIVIEHEANSDHAKELNLSRDLIV